MKLNGIDWLKLLVKKWVENNGRFSCVHMKFISYLEINRLTPRKSDFEVISSNNSGPSAFLFFPFPFPFFLFNFCLGVLLLAKSQIYFTLFLFSQINYEFITISDYLIWLRTIESTLSSPSPPLLQRILSLFESLWSWEICDTVFCLMFCI